MGTAKDALLIPQRAVGELQGVYQVAVVGADNTVKITNVKVGERVKELWIITEGLKAGDRVVAEGTQKVGDGAKVSPKPYTTAKEKAKAETKTKAEKASKPAS